MNNNNLHTAKKSKNDEFYTRYEDIDKELKHYNLKGKSIYCNTDDYRKSNFVKYFVDNFNGLGIDRITATCFDNGDGAYMYQYDGINAIQRKLEGNGDFRSAECVELLKQSDIVVTNPPFSLFRDFVTQVIEYDKKFLLVGNNNAITYKEIFPLIKDNKLWLGASIKSGDRKFYVPDNYPLNASGCGIDEKGKRFIRVKGVRWFTNIEDAKRNLPLDLYKKYNPNDYPKYDNYDAINVDKTSDIPMDYDGVMGVPITFLDKYCPTQFEIVGLMSGGKGENLTNGNDGRPKFYVNGKGVYARVLIRRKY